MIFYRTKSDFQTRQTAISKNQTPIFKKTNSDFQKIKQTPIFKKQTPIFEKNKLWLSVNTDVPLGLPYDTDSLVRKLIYIFYNTLVTWALGRLCCIIY